MYVTQQNLLDAMDGIAMVLDRELRITRIGRPNWQRFLDDNPPRDSVDPDRAQASVLGRPVMEFIAGDEVRGIFAELFSSVLDGKRPALRFDYRCDAPTVRRDMRLSVTLIETGAGERQLLYQSVTLSAQQRPAIPLFDAPVAPHQASDILTLCSICARVAWPLGAPSEKREWIEPAEYYRRGGADVAVISHCFCEDCYARLQEEDEN